MTHDTIPMRLVAQARARPDEPAYFVKQEGQWRATSWSHYAVEVERSAAALLALGLAPGQHIALVARNAPAWATLLLGAMSIGVRAAGIYPTTTPAELVRVLAHAEARLVLVDDAARLRELREAGAALPLLAHAVTLAPTPDELRPFAMSWAELLARGEAQRDQVVARRAALSPEDVASLVYTAGVERPPKGVLLSHRNLTSAADAARRVLHVRPEDISLSYLPLAHASEQLASVHAHVSAGHVVYFPGATERALEALSDVQPTLVLGVPRVWEALRMRFEERLSLLHDARASVVSWARDIARQVVAATSAGKAPSLDRALQYELAQKLVLDGHRRALGLARARLCVSGGGPLDPSTLAAFASLGIQLLEGYGSAETAGLATLNQPRRARPGSAGPRLPGSVVSIAPDGEILVEGPHVFQGYHRDSAATAEALIDGKLRTGDLGKLDREGFLTVFGRKRDLLLPAGGRSVAPAWLEASLRREPLIHDAVVVLDAKRRLCALLSIEEAAARELGLGGDLRENEIVRERVEDQLHRLNEQLPPSERIARYRLLPRMLSIAEGELAPSLELRRERVQELWAREIASLDETGRLVTQPE